jgi:DNA-binding response OmpR family regulator
MINDIEQRLTKKERLLMNLFLSHKNQVVSFDNIQNYVWEGSVASLESIRSLIRRVRKLLVNDYIQTVVDTGYIFKC